MSLRAMAVLASVGSFAVLVAGCNSDSAAGPESVSQLAVRDIQTSTCPTLPPADINGLRLTANDETQTNVDTLAAACSP